MSSDRRPSDGIGNAELTIRAHQLLSTVCVQGGVECPLMEAEAARKVLERVGSDPTVTIRLTSPADEVTYFRSMSSDDHANPSPEPDPREILNCKRDLDVLQRLGLVPGSIRRARYLYTLLFERFETLVGVCAYDTSGWEGCPLAYEGAYERVREVGWSAIVYQRPEEEIRRAREASVAETETGEALCIRSHHLMCLACWYDGGRGKGPRPNDTLYEILLRVQSDPDVPITMIEGCCLACDCCEGFHPESTRCVHGGGLIRDYKKDLDVFQKLGLMPGATLPAREAFALIFERIGSTTEICGYGDGVVRSEEWGICGGPKGNPGYQATRKSGVF